MKTQTGGNGLKTQEKTLRNKGEEGQAGSVRGRAGPYQRQVEGGTGTGYRKGKGIKQRSIQTEEKRAENQETRISKQRPRRKEQMARNQIHEKKPQTHPIRNKENGKRQKINCKN